MTRRTAQDRQQHQQQQQQDEATHNYTLQTRGSRCRCAGEVDQSPMLSSEGDGLLRRLVCPPRGRSTAPLKGAPPPRIRHRKRRPPLARLHHPRTWCCSLSPPLHPPTHSPRPLTRLSPRVSPPPQSGDACDPGNATAGMGRGLWGGECAAALVREPRPEMHLPPSRKIEVSRMSPFCGDACVLELSSGCGWQSEQCRAVHQRMVLHSLACG